MRRKLRLTALILCLALQLGACAGNDTEKQTETAGTADGQPGLEVVVEKHEEPGLTAGPQSAEEAAAQPEAAPAPGRKPSATPAPDAAPGQAVDMIPPEGLEGKCGDLSWTLDAAGTLRISGWGDMDRYSFGSLSQIPWRACANSIVRVEVQTGAQNIGDYAFYGCGALESVTIPGNVEEIGACAFAMCRSLREIEIPEGVRSLGDNAFYSCDALERVSLPASLTEIGESALNECAGLREIRVAEGSKAFSSLDGVLFDAAKETLLLHPRALGGAYAVPEGVREIGAFAFTACEELTELSIPESVETIGMAAFSGCSALAEARYAGSAKDWAGLTVSFGNDELLDSKIHLDGQREIVLTGGSDYSCLAALTWAEPGWIVTDGDGSELAELHDHVSVDGEIVSYEPGYYTLSYRYVDGDGEIFQSERSVEVTAAPLFPGEIPNERSIYLSFDGGPGPYTERLLDILAEYDVKATFFVSGTDPEHYESIRRAADEGHAIGVLSFSRDEQSIYSDPEAYFQDFIACEDLIREYTGSDTQIFRFPGGSSNTISNFNPGIMSSLAVTMQEMGYRYFDWNVSALNTQEIPYTPKQIFDLVSNGCAQQYFCIVCLSDLDENTVEAVADIIRWGQENGYSFLPLKPELFGWHHQISN